MAKVGQIYKSVKTGIIVEVLHAGDGVLSCDGEPMKLMEEGVSDGAVEKHVPVIEKSGSGYKVKVGSAPHPMEAKHSIEWIELKDGDTLYRRYLTPDDKPEAYFDNVKGDDVTAREYCNLHGLWKSSTKKA